MAPQYSASRAVTLGVELQLARKRAGFTQEQVAERIGRRHSHVSRWERGQLLPSPEQVAVLLSLYGVHEGSSEYDRVMHLAKKAADPNWITRGVNRTLATLAELEKIALRIVNVELTFIPGLLQTEAYARRIMASAGLTPDQVEERIRIRRERQKILERDNAPIYEAIIWEAALRHPPCDRATMAEQLRKLLVVGKRSTVSIRVLPFAAPPTPALEGTFVLIFPRRGEPQVQQEQYRVTATLTRRREVEDYVTAVDVIHREAMSVEDSAAFIGQLLQEMEGVER